MKSQKYQISQDFNETIIQVDTNLEYQKKRTYKRIWHRSYKKIKFQFLLKRYQTETSTYSYPSPDTIHAIPSISLKNPLSRKLIFLPHSKTYLFWLIIVLLSLLYLTIYGIFYTSFIGDDPTSLEISLESTIDIIFLLDILFTFNLAIINKRYQLVFNRKKIMEKYLKSEFFLDCFAGLPTGLIIKSHALHSQDHVLLFRHIPKLFKWYVVIKKMKNFTLTKFDYVLIKFRNTFDGIKIIVSFCILSHIFACLFYLAARVNYFDSGTWVFKAGIMSESITYKYTSSLYLSVFTVAGVGYGEIHPYTDVEKFLAMFWMTFATVFTSLSASQFSILMHNMLKKDLIIESDIQLVNDFSKYARVPARITNTIKNSIKEQRIITHKFTLSTILKNLNPSLKYEIAVDMYENGITKVPFFFNKSENFVSDLAFLLYYTKYEKNEIIWKKNSNTDGIYFVTSGRVKYLHEGILFFTYHAGGFFGDLEVFMKCERKFTVETCSLCKLFRLNCDKIEYLKENYPIYYKELKSMQERRQQNLSRSLSEMMAVYRNNGTIDKIQEIHNELTDEIFCFKLKPLKRALKEIKSGLKEIKKSHKRVKKIMETLNIPDNIDTYDIAFEHNFP